MINLEQIKERLHSATQRLAYEHWEAGGCRAGTDTEDWVAAQRSMRVDIVCPKEFEAPLATLLAFIRMAMPGVTVEMTSMVLIHPSLEFGTQTEWAKIAEELLVATAKGFNIPKVNKRGTASSQCVFDAQESLSEVAHKGEPILCMLTVDYRQAFIMTANGINEVPRTSHFVLPVAGKVPVAVISNTSVHFENVARAIIPFLPVGHSIVEGKRLCDTTWLPLMDCPTAIDIQGTIIQADYSVAGSGLEAQFSAVTLYLQTKNTVVRTPTLPPTDYELTRVLSSSLRELAIQNKDAALLLHDANLIAPCAWCMCQSLEFAVKSTYWLFFDQPLDQEEEAMLKAAMGHSVEKAIRLVPNPLRTDATRNFLKQLDRFIEGGNGRYGGNTLMAAQIDPSIFLKIFESIIAKTQTRSGLIFGFKNRVSTATLSTEAKKLAVPRILKI